MAEHSDFGDLAEAVDLPLPASAGAPQRSIAEMRSRFREGKAAMLAHFAQARPTAPAASRLIRGLARHVDGTLLELWQHAGMPGTAALLAVGGYGRGELFPYSDVDVLVLLPSTPALTAEQAAPAIEAFITACWDVGLEIGSSVRSVNECIAEAERDVTVRTALLESRYLGGARRLFNAFRRANSQAMDPRAFLRAKTLEMRQRHQRFEDTPYALEPNCKESPGGLRDLQVVIWVARAAGLGKTWGELAANGLSTPVRGQAVAAQRRRAEADPRPPAHRRRAPRRPPGVRPADRRGRSLRLRRQRRPACVRGVDASLLLGSEGGGAAQPDPDAQHRRAHQRLAGRADAPDQRQVLRPRRHAGSGERRPLPARPARHPRDLLRLPDDARPEGPVGANAARALQRPRGDERCLPARPGQPRDFHEDPVRTPKATPMPSG